jgi:hypothetical protein
MPKADVARLLIRATKLDGASLLGDSRELDPDGIQTERFAHLEARTLTNAPPKVL